MSIGHIHINEQMKHLDKEDRIPFLFENIIFTQDDINYLQEEPEYTSRHITFYIDIEGNIEKIHWDWDGSTDQWIIVIEDNKPCYYIWYTFSKQDLNRIKEEYRISEEPKNKLVKITETTHILLLLAMEKAKQLEKENRNLTAQLKIADYANKNMGNYIQKQKIENRKLCLITLLLSILLLAAIFALQTSH